MGIMEGMMETMINRMSKEDKESMMDKMMTRFFEGMTKEDKQKMMQDMMPRMMEGMTMMDMMSGMMSAEQGGMMGMMLGKKGDDCPADSPPPMAQMMSQMMPHCVEVMLPQLPKESRIDFSLKLVKSILNNGTAGMTEDEKKAFRQSLMETVQGATASA